jgi:hypothetical protein
MAAILGLALFLVVVVGGILFPVSNFEKKKKAEDIQEVDISNIKKFFRIVKIINFVGWFCRISQTFQHQALVVLFQNSQRSASSHRAGRNVACDHAIGTNYRAITNAGAHGMQEVPHYHLHILGGRVLGRLLEQA